MSRGVYDFNSYNSVIFSHVENNPFRDSFINNLLPLGPRSLARSKVCGSIWISILVSCDQIAVETPVLDRFREVRGLDRILVFKVCNGPGHL